jgi:hypothetical protein
MKPITGMKRSNCWKPARRVWFQKNDDSKDIISQMGSSKEEHQYAKELKNKIIEEKITPEQGANRFWAAKRSKHLPYPEAGFGED